MTDPQLSEPIANTIVSFLRQIGLDVRLGELPDSTFLPGILIEYGGLVVDPSRLRFPGDLLHEAGHLAVVPPDRRAAMHRDAGRNAGEEMAAIAWSYAALVHLGLDPAVVFHPDGYRGGSQALIENFAERRYVGVPILQWRDMSLDDRQAREQNLPPYPHMLRWLCPS
jgi:hypothetical protein